MHYEGERRGPTSRSIILGVAVLVLAAAAVAGLFFWQQAARQSRYAPEAITRELVEDPLGGRLFRALRETFPKDFAALVKRMSDMRRTGSTDRQLAQEGRRLIATKIAEVAPLISQAPAKELAEVRRTQLAVLNVLQTDDVLLCGRFATGGIVYDTYSRGELRPLLMDSTIATFRAGAAARDRPARRTIAAPPRADVDAMIKGLRQRDMTDRDLQIFFTPGGLARAPEWQQCVIAIAVWETVDAMPPDQAERITAFMLKR